MRLWICEKRDQAKNIAPLLGNPKPGQGYMGFGEQWNREVS